jgi:peptidyl-prolyl cis-trans isomerase B (cyclophilin B)
LPVSARHIRPLSCLCAGSLALLLGACGSSHGGTSGTSNSSGSKSASGASGKSGTSAHGCRVVSAPSPKGSQHIPKPNITLNQSKRYVVNLETNCGTIQIQLAVKQAPKTAASFVYLVKRGFYNDLTFHRVVSGFVIQGGDPDGNGSGGPGYTVVEQPPADLQYTTGVVAMAKTATDPSGASGSQFFIVTGKNAGLPAQYALLGTVTGGLHTVEEIAGVPTKSGPDGEDSTPRSPIVISRATLSVS